MKKTVWFDIDNVPHVNFFLPIIKRLDGEYNLIFTVKDFAETQKLFEKLIGFPYISVGNHKGRNKLAKVYGVLERTIQLLLNVPKFDLKISIGGDSSNLCAKLRGKKSITFDDNEQAPNWRYSWISDFAFWPKAVPDDILFKQNFKRKKMFKYDGFKEDIYIADYKPDKDFLKGIPFDNYVVVRAENIKANYVDGRRSIVPELVLRLEEKGYNVIFLPRYPDDIRYVKNRKNVFVPKEPLNGLDLCHFADAVLTGAGTFAREAACLGVPAFSFYAGTKLLKVDEELINQGKIFYTRKVEEIITKLNSIKRTDSNIDNSKKVQEQLLIKLFKVIERFV